MTLNSHPLLWRVLLFVAAPLVATGAVFLHKVRTDLPASVLHLKAPGQGAAVVITRDSHGVPTIVSTRDEGAFFGLGYAHAQDRLWQLEVLRRTAQGRLSEIFGAATLRQDIWLRTLGLSQSVRSDWEGLSTDARNSLSAYAEGVNARLREQASLAPEFAVFSVKPERWTVYDSLLVQKLFALNLAVNFRRELEALAVSQVLPANKRSTFFPAYTASLPDAVTAGERPRSQLSARYEQLMASLGLGGAFVGSNAWVVAGRLSSNGHSLLANDPHLALQIPSIWYFAQLRGSRLHAGGATLAGMPLVIFGRNARIAWGGTSMLTDTQDLYRERLDAADPSRYEVNGEWRAFDERVERIRVKPDFPAFLRDPSEPVAVRVRSSRHGPIVSDALGEPGGEPLALRWVALETGDTSYEAFFELNYAQDWSGFRAAVSHLVAPSLNMLFTDQDGHVGYVGAGAIPIRRSGNGALPAEGWNDAQEWIGRVPPARWPQLYDPPDGIIVSANQRMVDGSEDFFIASEWAPPERAQRIRQLLQEKLAGPGRRVSMDDMARIQADTVDLSAHSLLPILLAVNPADMRQREALEWLARWNADMSAESPAPAIFFVWMRYLRQSLFADDFTNRWDGAAVAEQRAAGADLSVVQAALSEPDEVWCDRVDTPVRESCASMLQQSLNSALHELNKSMGSDMAQWRWRSIHTAVFDSLPASGVKVMDRLLQRRAASQGTPKTVNAANASFQDSRGYVQDFGAGFRQIIAMDHDTPAQWFMNSTGQSGLPWSPHYDDMVEPFHLVQYFTIPDAAGGRP